MNSMNRSFCQVLSATAAALTLFLGAGAWAKEAAPVVQRAPANDSGSSGEFRDAYLKGRIVSELLLDPHVSVFDFSVKVDNGVAYLDGTVDKDIERDIAVEVARGVDGVKEVQSSIQVRPGTRKERAERQPETFGQALDDATVTASVKTKLLANANTSGLRIHVRTAKGTVTLSGRVQTPEEKDLAGRIAQNTQGAMKVQNLIVASRNSGETARD